MGSICSKGYECLPPVGAKPSATGLNLSSTIFSSLYKVSERVLSNSSQCQVRLCKKLSSQKLYALKKVSISSSPFSLEAEILKNLDHPNVIKLEGYYQEGPEHCLVLEYLPHGDLSGFLTKITRLPEKTAAEVMQQVLSALHHCHKRGVVHRDIKPENILLSSIGKKGISCKLADFDSAGLLDKAGKGIYGTLYYTAPEIFCGKYDEKVDIWSAGVMLYQLLTGRHLFCGANNEEIQEKINREEIVLDNAISSEARDLLEKMLVREASSRISAKEACMHPWFMKRVNNKSNSEVRLAGDCRSSVVEMYKDYFIHNILTKKQMKMMSLMFRKLDTEFEGEICSDQGKCDGDSCNKISFSEFLRGSIPRDELRNRENVQRFFYELDFGARNALVPQDLKQCIQNEKYQKALDELLQVIFTSKLREMQFEEFFNLIVKNT